MIPANKSPILDSLLYFYFRRLFARSFHTVAASGLEKLRALPKDRPVILFCNHSSWWDGLVVFMLTREVSHKSVYCMMEEKQLKEYRFFSWLGAFSVDLSSPVRAGASIRYAIKLLRKSDTALWIFPQGKICPAQAPIEVRPGTDYMAKHAPHALLVPVAFRYEFFREDRPNCLIWVGDPFPSVNCTNQRIQESCQESFAAINKAAVAQDLTGFKLLFTPRLPVNKQWQWFRFALTGRLREFKATN